MKFVDTHCHLSIEPLFSSIEAVLGRARDRDIQRIIVPAYDRDSWGKIDSIASNAEVLPSFGLHPWVADENFTTKELLEQIEGNRVVAIGEIGLDFKIQAPPRALQIAVFELQLDLALQLDLPVLLHCRGAFEEMLEILGRYSPRGLRGVVHAFSRGPELAKRFTDLGLYLAYGGSITRPGATRPRNSAGKVPMERILLETDAPSIGLDGVPPEQVEPHHVRDIAQSLAQIRGVPITEIARVTTQNALDLFQWKV